MSFYVGNQSGYNNGTFLKEKLLVGDKHSLMAMGIPPPTRKELGVTTPREWRLDRMSNKELKEYNQKLQERQKYYEEIGKIKKKRKRVGKQLNSRITYPPRNTKMSRLSYNGEWTHVKPKSRNANLGRRRRARGRKRRRKRGRKRMTKRMRKCRSRCKTKHKSRARRRRCRTRCKR